MGAPNAVRSSDEPVVGEAARREPPPGVHNSDEWERRGTPAGSRSTDMHATTAAVSDDAYPGTSRAVTFPHGCNPHVGIRRQAPAANARGASGAAPVTNSRSSHVGIRHQTPPAKARSANKTPLEPPASNLDAAVLRVQGKQALVGLGWKPAIAESAVAAALAALGPACRWTS